MRAGYLAALAARTLGTAPVLQPPTPSRFEPESPQAELREVTETSDASAATPLITPGPAGHAPDRVLLPQPPPSRRRETHEPDMIPDRPSDWIAHEARLSQEVGARAADLPDGAAVRRPPRRGAMWPDADADSAILMPQAAAARAADLPEETAGRRAPSGPIATRADTDIGSATLMPQAAGEPAEWLVASVPAVRAVPSAGRAARHGDVREGGRAQLAPDIRGETTQRPVGSGEPSVVVHIGRVVVRAVHAPRPPAPVPRSRPSDQQSLADYLLARDRGRK